MVADQSEKGQLVSHHPEPGAQNQVSDCSFSSAHRIKGCKSGQMSFRLIFLALSLSACGFMSAEGNGAASQAGSGSSGGASDCVGPCRTAPVELLRRMMFENNPTGRTAFGVMTVRRYLRGQCLGNPPDSNFVSNTMVFDAGSASPEARQRGWQNLRQGDDIFDYGIFRPGDSIHSMFRKRTPVLIGAGACDITSLPPTVDNLRQVFIIDDREEFSRRVAKLRPDGSNRVVRRSGSQCVHEMELSSTNKINILNSYILIARPTIDAMKDKATIVCLYRGTLASVGLPGAFTVPEDELVELVMERMPPGGFAPFFNYWKTEPLQALRYVRPGGETWEKVKQRISDERGL